MLRICEIASLSRHFSNNSMYCFKHLLIWANICLSSSVNWIFPKTPSKLSLQNFSALLTKFPRLANSSELVFNIKSSHLKEVSAFSGLEGKSKIFDWANARSCTSCFVILISRRKKLLQKMLLKTCAISQKFCFYIKYVIINLITHYFC